MKIFQTFEGFICFLFGQAKWIRTSRVFNSIQKYPCSFINLLPWLYINICLILSLGFLAFNTHTFQEYSDCIFGVLVALSSTFVSTIMLLNRAEFFNFIDNIEHFIEKRKLMSTVINR